jgi:hypothetical protein
MPAYKCFGGTYFLHLQGQSEECSEVDGLYRVQRNIHLFLFKGFRLSELLNTEHYI